LQVREVLEYKKECTEDIEGDSPSRTVLGKKTGEVVLRMIILSIED